MIVKVNDLDLWVIRDVELVQERFGRPDDGIVLNTESIYDYIVVIIDGDSMTTGEISAIITGIVIKSLDLYDADGKKVSSIPVFEDYKFNLTRDTTQSGVRTHVYLRAPKPTEVVPL